jgi:dephospho-CoA kinase
MKPQPFLDKAVVVAGKTGSGKSTAVSSISERFGLKIVSFGEVVRARGSELGLRDSRTTLQELGHQMFVSLGARVLLQTAMKHAGVERDQSVAFDGVRHHLVLDEIKAIAKTTVMFYLEIDDVQRYQRYLSKSPSDSSMTFGEFLEIDRHPIEAGISQLVTTADVVIDATLPLLWILDQMRRTLTARGFIRLGQEDKK